MKKLNIDWMKNIDWVKIFFESVFWVIVGFGFSWILFGAMFLNNETPLPPAPAYYQYNFDQCVKKWDDTYYLIPCHDVPAGVEVKEVE
ncbi:MAG: hypothetical protein VXB01_02560 [Opitutae bacterium]